MRQIPAKCGNCGYLFPSGYSFDPGETGVEATLTVQATAPVSTPSPMCGRKMGQVLEGEYNFVKDTITLLSGPESTKVELEQLAAFLSQFQGAITVAEIQEKADKERPELSSLITKLLASRPARMELAAWLAVVLTAIALLQNGSNREKPEPAQVIYEINNFNITCQEPPSSSEQQAIGKVGRNQPCPCGSGRKFKKCHGGSSIVQLQP